MMKARKRRIFSALLLALALALVEILAAILEC